MTDPAAPRRPADRPGCVCPLDNGPEKGRVERPHAPSLGATMVSFRVPPDRPLSRARPAATVVLALCVALTLVGGCGGNEAEPEAIPSAPETSASAPTPTPATPSASADPATGQSPQRRAAEAALDRYLQVEARLYADPDLDVAALDDVSYGLARTQAESYLRQARQQQITESGPTRVISRTVVERKLRSDPPTFVIEQCMDGSQVEVMQGGEPYEGTRTDRNLTTYGVSLWQQKWQVSFIELRGPNQC